MKIKDVLYNPKKILFSIGIKGGFKFLSDRLYLKLMYWSNTGKKLNLDNPTTFNEKIQWLKLNDKKNIYTHLVDKSEVKKIVSNIIGEEYIIPTIGIYDRFEDIDFEKLPNQFVLKCTHDSGGVVICKNKIEFDIVNARKIIEKSLKNNYFYSGREWPYKNVKPKIIVEKYMVDESEKELKDYKFFCFDGEPKMMFIAKDRGNRTKFNFYDLEFNKLPFKQHYENFEENINKPWGFEKMIELSKKLSENLKHVRIDFYDVGGKVYFGEMTFYHFSGFEKFEPEEWDKKIGDFLNLQIEDLKKK